MELVLADKMTLVSALARGTNLGSRILAVDDFESVSAFNVITTQVSQDLYHEPIRSNRKRSIPRPHRGMLAVNLQATGIAISATDIAQHCHAIL